MLNRHTERITQRATALWACGISKCMRRPQLLLQPSTKGSDDPHLNQYGPSHTEPDWQTVATTAYTQTKPLRCGWERAQPTLCSKNVDPGLTLWVNKELLPWTAPSLINLQNRDIYILVHAIFSNDLLCLLVLCWLLWCHQHIVKSNYLQIGWTPVLIYALSTLLFPPGILSALLLFAGSHCKQGAALVGSVSLKPLNYSIQTYSRPHVSSLLSTPAEFVEAEPE